MKPRPGHIAVVTGAGSGIGRELALRLAAEGCSLAICGLSEAKLTETRALCEAVSPPGARIFAQVVDVTDEAGLEAFREALSRALETDRIHLLFNNAGITGDGGVGFVAGDRAAWDRVFDICWGGVYNGCRVFLPMLMAAEEGCIVNISSLCAVRATFGPGSAPTAYASAKFAVRGFTEALIGDLRLNAPHLRCFLVIPGQVGTDLIDTSRRILAGDPEPASASEASRRFRETAPVSAAAAAAAILDGVRAGRWRILVGRLAKRVDALARARPEAVYEAGFERRLRLEKALDLLLGLLEGGRGRDRAVAAFRGVLGRRTRSRGPG